MKPVKKNKKKSPFIYIVAGEASGDILGARLLHALKEKDRNIRFAGVGGESLRDKGLSSLFPIRDLAVMGLLEVVPSIPRILRRMGEVVADIKQKKPDVVVTVDSFSFSIRLLKRLKKECPDVKRVHYVAPQVWAWKPGRAPKLKGIVDELLMLLPFEDKYFTPYDVPCTFVGHPVIESGADKGDPSWFFKKNPVKNKVLCLMPGSRRSEIKFLLPIYKDMLSLLKKKGHDLTVAVPTVEAVAADVKLAVTQWPFPTLVIEGQKNRYDTFAAAQAGVIASGTASLEAVMAGLPHVITYKVSFISYILMRLLVKIKFANLINLMAGKEIISELLQGKCTPKILAKYADEMLRGKRVVSKEAVAQLKKMRPDGFMPSEKAAETILGLID